jgi:hypothetical protein
MKEKEKKARKQKETMDYILYFQSIKQYYITLYLYRDNK